MSCSYGNYCFYQTLKFETCEHEEFASSTNSLHHPFQIKYEEENNTDEEIHKCCKECVDKKHNVRALMNIEEADSCDTNNKNAAIDNEGSTTITNEQRYFEGSHAPTLFLCDEGKIAIADFFVIHHKINVMKK